MYYTLGGQTNGPATSPPPSNRCCAGHGHAWPPVRSSRSIQYGWEQGAPPWPPTAGGRSPHARAAATLPSPPLKLTTTMQHGCSAPLPRTAPQGPRAQGHPWRSAGNHHHILLSALLHYKPTVHPFELHTRPHAGSAAPALISVLAHLLGKIYVRTVYTLHRCQDETPSHGSHKSQLFMNDLHLPRSANG